MIFLLKIVKGIILLIFSGAINVSLVVYLSPIMNPLRGIDGVVESPFQITLLTFLSVIVTLMIRDELKNHNPKSGPS